MKPEAKDNLAKVYAVLGYIVTLYVTFHYGIVSHIHKASGFFSTLGLAISHLKEHPFRIFPFYSETWQYIGLITFIYAVVAVYLFAEAEKNHHDLSGKESGSAKWCKDYKKYDKEYTSPFGIPTHDGNDNMILSQEVFLSMDTRHTQFNNNVLVIGGSGSGKSRFFVKPNLLQANCNYVVTDPAGELLASTGKFLMQQGYDIKVFNLVEMSKSNIYNPFKYIRNDEEVLTMIDCLIANTTPPKSKGGDPFWDKSEKALLQALCFLLIKEYPKEKHTFTKVMELLTWAEIDETNPKAKSRLDEEFERVAKRDPASIAVKQYRTFKMGAGKTLKSILISCAVRLTVFNLQQVANLTSIDDIDLASMGTGKKALFVITPQASQTYNFLVSMLYSQLFETLYYEGNKKLEEGKRLDREVRFLLDEFVNIGQIPQFTKKLATMRKYGISCSVIIQNIAQLKPLYEDWETIIGNCDSMIFLGGLEYSTLEYISNILGTATIRTRSLGRSKGKSGSSSMNFQQSQRKLLNPDEVGNIPNNYCLIKIRSLNPFFCHKYDYSKHPNYKFTGDFDSKLNYINELDNNKGNSISEEIIEFQKTYIDSILKSQENIIAESVSRDAKLWSSTVSINEWLSQYNIENALNIFDKFKLLSPVNCISPEEEKVNKEKIIKMIFDTEKVPDITTQMINDILATKGNEEECNDLLISQFSNMFC